mgnify:CR=1 FL=1
MSYQEAWEELQDRLKRADQELTQLPIEHPNMSKTRLYNKRAGVRLALDYMRGVERSIDPET